MRVWDFLSFLLKADYLGSPGPYILYSVTILLGSGIGLKCLELCAKDHADLQGYWEVVKQRTRSNQPALYALHQQRLTSLSRVGILGPLFVALVLCLRILLKPIWLNCPIMGLFDIGVLLSSWVLFAKFMHEARQSIMGKKRVLAMGASDPPPASEPEPQADGQVVPDDRPGPAVSEQA